MDKGEIEKKFPGDWAKRDDNKYDFRHESGESYREVDENRVRPLLNEFREKYSSRKLLVITHQGTARLVIGNLLGLSPEEKMLVDFPNNCVYRVSYLPHKTEITYSLVGLGESDKGYIKREGKTE